MRPNPSPVGGRRKSRLAALLLFLLGWAFAGVVTAGPAAAHAEMLTSDPVSGAALGGSPSQLTLTFSETVTQVPVVGDVVGELIEPVRSPLLGG